MEKLLTDEILRNNGFKIQEGLAFPFDCTPLYENENHSVYIVDCGEDFNPRWMYGLTSEYMKEHGLNGNEFEGVCNTVIDFNKYLSRMGFNELSL